MECDSDRIEVKTCSVGVGNTPKWRRRRQGRVGKGGGDLAQVLGTVTRVDLVCETVPAAQGLDRGIGDAARGRRGGRAIFSQDRSIFR